MIMKKISQVLVATGLFSLMAGIMLVPMLAMAQVPDKKAGSNTSAADAHIKFQLENPLKNTTTVQGFLVKLLDAAVLLLSPVIVLMLIYSGLKFVIARGNEEQLKNAKDTLLYTLIGAAIVLGAKGLSLVIENTIRQF